MLSLILIGFVGGLITSVSPCVLPMLPVVFFATGTDDDASEGSGRWRPVIIIAGLVTAFCTVTLVGATLLSLLGLPDSFLRWTGVVVLTAVGIGMIVPGIGHLLEKPFYRLPKVTGGRGGPFLLGLGLGTLYVPCAGPVLVAITVAGATGQVGTGTVVLTVAFGVGAALPLLIFAAAGSNIRRRIATYRRRAGMFRVIGGATLVALAVGLVFNLPQVLQRVIPNYTSGLETALAESDAVQGALTPFETDENRLLSRCTPGDDELADCGPAPRLRGTGEWFNTPDRAPLSLADLRGEVVLLDFFAYSCINCQRDQPYIERWAQAYEDAGLTVVGVHSPEFAFEKSAGNLAAALEKEGTTYPVVQDNDLATWTAYRNRYWPAKYLIDRTGTVRAITFGEGGYDRTESLLRQLLVEDGDVALPDPVTDVGDAGLTAGRTPELYLADNRPGYVGSPRYLDPGPTAYTFTGGAQPRDTYGLAGTWSATPEHVTATAGAQVRLRFRAAKVHHVLAGEGTVTVSQPGRPDRRIEVSGAPNLYTLVDGDDVIEETLTLTYSAGIEAYTFTFG